ncbi:MAG: hypothetical protein V2I43_21610 [Parvularcula sp.]|jgi:hypothetical protein|nr:hypothetical protein [Parvularcula sp.]
MQLRVLAGTLALMLSTTSLASSQASGAPPASIIGKYLVYDSGSVTSFYKRNLIFGFTQTVERYEYSKEGRQGAAALVTYNARSGTIKIQDLLSAEEKAELIRKNSIYRRCAGDIFRAPVRLKIVPAINSTTRAPLAGVWNVRQDTYTCEIINVQHASRDNSCTTTCVRYHKQPSPRLRNMKLYSDKNRAMALGRNRAR